MARVETYKTVHKGIRAALFEAVAVVGRTEFGDEAEAAAAGAAVRRTSLPRRARGARGRGRDARARPDLPRAPRRALGRARADERPAARDRGAPVAPRGGGRDRARLARRAAPRPRAAPGRGAPPPHGPRGDRGGAGAPGEPHRRGAPGAARPDHRAHPSGPHAGAARAHPPGRDALRAPPRPRRPRSGARTGAGHTVAVPARDPALEGVLVP